MFGIWGHKKAAEITYYGLHSMQHRGQDGAGIVVTDGEQLNVHKDVGLVNDVFKRYDFAENPGHAAIGHVRNATQDDGVFNNVQPFVFHTLNGSTAIAHNGKIVNADSIRRNLEETGSILQTTSDTEVLAHLMRKNSQKTTEEAIIESLKQLVGAYAFLILTEDKLYVALDPRGIRPLSLGKLGDAYVVASETCAFNIIGATFEREVMPGELLTISNEGIKSTRFLLREPRNLCAMEYVYFSRPDSDLNEVNVHTARKRMGIELAKEHPKFDADVVTGVPDSSISAAIGYAEQCGLPYEMGVLKNRYIGRTFIQPSQELREQGVKMKLSPVRGVVEGKSVVMIDDSIVRGTTSRRIVRLLKEAGAREVHVRISSPRIENPCLYGIDMLTKKELIAANHTNEEIKDLIEADSIEFLSVEGMEKAIIKDKTLNQGVCAACMTGNYPVLENDQRKEFYRKY
ncbi:amidophosphoribosyltransferase [Pseudogracilibacillus sp. SE30717A]|uniref:amidophosphoribosyltransferase n=1 Tax=Pseudogracilibacillus sp. SE30717A TaxID=3098293 RepID=UPI003FA77E2D